MKPRLLALALLAAGLLSLGWWVREFTSPVETTRQAGEESPDAYAEQLKVHTYDATGRLQQTLTTPQMEHYASSSTSELSRPVLWRFNPDSPPWRMRGEQAFANDEQARVFLPGEVVIDREGNEANPPYHIVTRDLTLETDTAHATTAEAVSIESGAQWITAVGMEGWLREPIKLNLLSQVRGHYEFD